MNQSPVIRNLTQCMSSSNPGLRLSAWDQLFEKQYTRWYQFFFYGKSGSKSVKGAHNQQDAGDLLHDMYFKIRRRLINKPLNNTNVSGYLWQTQYTMLMDYWRKQIRYQSRYYSFPGVGIADTDNRFTDYAQWQYLEETFNQKSLSIEEQLGLKWSCKETIDLGMRVLKPKDRLLLSLMGVQQFTAHQAYCLMGLSLRGCYRHFHKIADLLGTQWPVASSLTERSFDWMNELNFGITPTGISVFYLNTNLQNLAPESKYQLYRSLSVKSLAELTSQYHPALLIHGIDTLESVARIVFLPKRDLQEDMLTGHKIHYIEFAPVFERTVIRGKKQEQLFLQKAAEYTGQATCVSKNPHTSLPGIEFLYNLPNGSITIYKSLTPTFKHVLKTKNMTDEVFLASVAHPAGILSR